MTTTAVGRQAEAAAVAYLQHHGCQILDQNWRTRWCEIDIVAERAQRLYFCEVKYRRNTTQGGGIDYITPKKLHQMQFAADYWVSTHAWTHEYQLCAIEVTGPTFRITAVIKDF